MPDFKYALGVQAKDFILGFKGLILGRSDFITGCNQYLIQPPLDADGKYVDSRWVDEDRIHVENPEPAVAVPRAPNSRPGGDKPAPRK